MLCFNFILREMIHIIVTFDRKYIQVYTKRDQSITNFWECL